MFSFPVTIPVRKDDAIFPVFVSVNCDDIALVKSLLDNNLPFGVESCSLDLIPQAEIVFLDGRRLPVLETAHIIHNYLDAYLALETFYTADHNTASRKEGQQTARTDNVVPLFGSGKPCDTSEESIPG